MAIIVAASLLSVLSSLSPLSSNYPLQNNGHYQCTSCGYVALIYKGEAIEHE